MQILPKVWLSYPLSFISGLTGCSPQEESFWTGSYRDLPKPPATARMQVGVSTEDDGEILASGAIVDQAKGVILLPGGNVLDGKTGNITNSDGELIKELDAK